MECENVQTSKKKKKTDSEVRLEAGRESLKAWDHSSVKLHILVCRNNIFAQRLITNHNDQPINDERAL
jgi:hypothetical protein